LAREEDSSTGHGQGQEAHNEEGRQ
jgi:hypothetical protein